ncbi:peptidoglycan DD-metalloendopeptidase family protein [bacterium]|nr:peptidoglycan DD-metalloendopeptidase family protein [bacterium]
MAKVKFYYDPNSLSYRKIEKGWKHRLREVGLFLTAAMLMAVLLVWIGFWYIDSPEEKRLKRELDFMRLQYEMIDQRLAEMSGALEELEERDDNIYRVVFEAEPIPDEVRKGGFGGANRYAGLVGYEHSELVRKTSERVDVLAKELYVQSRSFDEVVGMAKRKSELLSCIPAIQPISNKNLTRIASGFGYRIHPIYKVGKMHTGIDFTAPTGTPIYAAGDGVVNDGSSAGGSGYGIHVIVNHGYGYQTLYGHMSKRVVRNGQKVKRGELIGYVGNTGTSTAPHLHYEVIKSGTKVDPIHYFFNDLTPAQYQEVLALAGRENQSFD